MLREMFAKCLARHVGTLLVARNGAEGLKFCDASKPDLIITDILMPVMDGLEMVERIRENGHVAPIIFLTGSPEKLNGFIHFDKVRDEILTKPTDFQKLSGMLRQHAARKKRHGIALSGDALCMA